MSFKIWMLILFLILLVVFSIQNIEPTTIKLLVWETTLSSTLLILITFFLGLAIGFILRNLKKPFKRG